MKFSSNRGTSLKDSIVISGVTAHAEMIEEEYAIVRSIFGRFCVPTVQELIKTDLENVEIPFDCRDLSSVRFHDRITVRPFPWLRKKQIYFDVSEGIALLELGVRE